MRESISQACEAADALEKSGQIAEAALIYCELVAREKNDAEISRRAGMMCMRAGEVSSACRCFINLVNLQPGSAEAHALLAGVMDRNGHISEALIEYEKAARLEPERAVHHFNLAVSARRAGVVDAAEQSFRDCVRLEPGFVDARRGLASLLFDLGRQAEAVDFLRASVRLIPDSVQLLEILADFLGKTGQSGQAAILRRQVMRLDPENRQRRRSIGIARAEEGKYADAAASFESALESDPLDPGSMTDLAVTLKRQGRLLEAQHVHRHAEFLHRRRPGRWTPSFGKETAELQSMNAESSPTAPAFGRGGPKMLSVLVGCYGKFSDYSLRAIDSIVGGRDVKQHCDIFIGMNQCADATVKAVRSLTDLGLIDGVVQSPHNINKDPMMRLLLDLVRTPYVVWLDDDSWFIDSNWPTAFSRAVAREAPFDVAGQLGRWGPRRDTDGQYMEFIQARPWWTSGTHYPAELWEWVMFAVGGLFIARTEFLRHHDFPDRGMIKALDDVALGELVQQVGGRLIGLDQSLLSMVKISDGQRRGENFELVDGWDPSVAVR